jgi:hypothetical protein
MPFDRDRAPSQWETVETFTAPAGRNTIAVQVRRDVSVPWPKLSYSIGRWDGEKVQFFMAAETERLEDGSRELVFLAPTIMDLMTKAEALVADIVKRNNEQQANRPRRDFSAPSNESGGPRGNSGPRGGNGGHRHFDDETPRSPMRKGKTARDHNRGRRHDEN